MEKQPIADKTGLYSMMKESYVQQWKQSELLTLWAEIEVTLKDRKEQQEEKSA